MTTNHLSRDSLVICYVIFLKYFFYLSFLQALASCKVKCGKRTQVSRNFCQCVVVSRMQVSNAHIMMLFFHSMMLFHKMGQNLSHV